MLTITEVLQKCEALNVLVSKRRLIDFQKLGLLPRGEHIAGHGRVYYFPEDVVQQVLAIEVFIHRRRALVASHSWSTKHAARIQKLMARFQKRPITKPLPLEYLPLLEYLRRTDWGRAA